MACRLSVEKMEALERKHRVEISATAYLERDEDDEDNDSVKVISEVVSSRLDYDLSVIVSVYNPSGEIIGTDYAYIDSDTFEGIEPFSIEISIPKGENVGRVRVYPKQN
ncbi:hypothetical protein [Paenibacillus sp. GCM10027626]|uniref:hypothetical protein n=1 Tax=Paenibacillus sp. GCM10027626 TaxID=3273411 RepID=UPI0036295D43